MTTYNKPPGSGPKRIQDIQRENANSQGKNVTRKTVIQQFAPVQQPSGGPAVTGVSPISVAGNAVSIAAASASGAGALAAADFSTFAAKEPGLGNPGVNGYLLSSTTTGVRSWVAPGGGSSPYTPPLLAGFTIANTPGASTATDTTSGLVLYAPNMGGLSLFALEDNTAAAATFTVTCGFNSFMLNANAGVGILVRDAGGKVITYGIDSTGANGGNYNWWNSYSSFNATQINKDAPRSASFIRIVSDGTNFYLYSGTDINAMLLLGTTPCLAFIGAATKVGLYAFGNSQDVTAAFFHYSHV